jgi:site-specific DNA-methyltransferase (adenine-specific)
MCIRLHGLNKTKLVLDPFLGIGNSALACAHLGVNFVGFEIDSEYFQVSTQRIANG